MYPIASSKINCLERLVGVRTDCEYNGTNEPPFFIEDIEGLDVKKLAALAPGPAMKGKGFGSWIINSAARQMMGDIESLMNSAYSLKNVVGQTCSSCQLLPTYTANAGIIIKSSVYSSFQVLQITRLSILANVSGVKELNIDDGVTIQKFNPNLTAGVIVPIQLDYSTEKKSVKIYFTDPTIGLGQVLCTTQSGCGCGGSSTSTSPITISGLLAGNENVTQYGFLPCAGVSCSYDQLICGLVNYAPNIFGLTMLYKVGDIATVMKNQSSRNNETASFNEEQDSELQRKFGMLYWAKMKGTGNVKGIRDIINSYLRGVTADKCVVCEAKVYTAGATG